MAIRTDKPPTGYTEAHNICAVYLVPMCLYRSRDLDLLCCSIFNNLGRENTVIITRNPAFPA